LPNNNNFPVLLQFRFFAQNQEILSKFFLVDNRIFNSARTRPSKGWKVQIDLNHRYFVDFGEIKIRIVSTSIQRRHLFLPGRSLILVHAQLMPLLTDDPAVGGIQFNTHRDGLKSANPTTPLRFPQLRPSPRRDCVAKLKSFLSGRPAID
jgi:hypothetical protein